MKKTRVIHTNRAASMKYDFTDAEDFVCGVVLAGPDVKLIKDGRVGVRDGYCSVFDGSLLLHNLTVGADRKTVKLLVNKKQLAAISKAIEIPGAAAVPVLVLEVNGWVKIKVSLARGRKKHDKRAHEKDKQHRREIERHE